MLLRLEFFLLIFEEYSNIKCLENPSSRNQVVPRGADGQTYMTKLTVVFAILRKYQKPV